MYDISQLRGVTCQCYLPPNTSEHSCTPLPYPHLDKPLLDLSILEGWKAELT